MIFSLALIVLGIAFVTYGARMLVSGGSSLARRLKVSDLIIGLTIVALGTSAPELMVSVAAALSGSTEVALGNVVGSNIANICLILAICAIITPLSIQRNTVRAEVPLALLGVLIAFVLSQDEMIDQIPPSVISRIDGLVLLGFFAIYMAYMLALATNSRDRHLVVDENNRISVGLAIVMVIGGMLGLAFGGDFIVKGAVDVARNFEISEAVIGLTLVSVGTSIPELATSVVAAVKRNSDIAVGNVVGSNLFNTFLILGTSSTIAPLKLGAITLTDFLVNIAATIFLLVSAFINTPSRVNRPEGICLLLMYIGYMVYLFWKM
jgi:cation:H+ antiporter